MGNILSPSAQTIAPDFTPAELRAMHRWCLRYRDLVRGGGTPSKDQDELFMLFSRATYAAGVACE